MIGLDSATTAAKAAKEAARRARLNVGGYAVVSPSGSLIFVISANPNPADAVSAGDAAKLAVFLRREYGLGTSYAFLIYDQEGDVAGAIGIAGIGAHADNTRKIAFEAIWMAGYFVTNKPVDCRKWG